MANDLSLVATIRQTTLQRGELDIGLFPMRLDLLEISFANIRTIDALSCRHDQGHTVDRPLSQRLNFREEYALRPSSLQVPP